MKIQIVLCGLMASAFVLPPRTSAAVSIGDRVQVAGFFSQGYIKSDGNNYPITSASGSDEFREMAINASGSVGAHLRLGAQLFAQRLGPYGNDRVILDWAVADYNFRQEFGLQAGRIKMAKSLYSEALDLDLVRPFIFLPGSIYNPILRDFSASFDGVQAYGSISAGRGSVDYKVYYGDIAMKPEQGVADYYNNTGLFAMPTGVGKLGVDYVAGAAVLWNTPVSGLRFGVFFNRLSQLSAQGRLAMAPVVPVVVRGQNGDATVFAAEYAVSNWTLAAEFMRSRDRASVISPVLPAIVAPNGYDSWYVSVARRLDAHWELGGYYSRSTDAFPAAGAPRASNRSADWTLSARYDVSEHLTFKLEGHYVDGTRGILDTPRLPNPAAGLRATTLFWAVKTTLSF